MGTYLLKSVAGSTGSHDIASRRHLHLRSRATAAHCRCHPLLGLEAPSQPRTLESLHRDHHTTLHTGLLELTATGPPHYCSTLFRPNPSVPSRSTTSTVAHGLWPHARAGDEACRDDNGLSGGRRLQITRGRLTIYG
jgi:hypothetical protein